MNVCSALVKMRNAKSINGKIVIFWTASLFDCHDLENTSLKHSPTTQFPFESCSRQHLPVHFHHFKRHSTRCNRIRTARCSTQSRVLNMHGVCLAHADLPFRPVQRGAHIPNVKLIFGATINYGCKHRREHPYRWEWCNRKSRMVIGFTRRWMFARHEAGVRQQSAIEYRTAGVHRESRSTCCSNLIYDTYIFDIV